MARMDGRSEDRVVAVALFFVLLFRVMHLQIRTAGIERIVLFLRNSVIPVMMMMILMM